MLTFGLKSWVYVQDTKSWLHVSGNAVIWQALRDNGYYFYVSPIGKGVFSAGGQPLNGGTGPFHTLGQAKKHALSLRRRFEAQQRFIAKRRERRNMRETA